MAGFQSLYPPGFNPDAIALAAGARPAESVSLPRELQKTLCNTSYEKRKSAALDLEKIIKSTSDLGYLFGLLVFVQRTFIASPLANLKKGGLIALASAAIGLDNNRKIFQSDGQFASGQFSSVDLPPNLSNSSASNWWTFLSGFLHLLIPPVLSLWEDEDARVRYYACESLFNILKVSRSAACKLYFNEIFDAAGRHTADMDVEVQGAAFHLNRLLKDILTERTYDEVVFPNLLNFIPLLSERILNSKNPMVCSFLLGWVSVLQDYLPDRVLLPQLPRFLKGLFGMLVSSHMRDIRINADGVLKKFLKQKHSVPSEVVSEIVPVLAEVIAESKKETQKKILALFWLRTFAEMATLDHTGGPASDGQYYYRGIPLVDHGCKMMSSSKTGDVLSEELIPFSLLPLFLTSILSCVDDAEVEVGRMAVETHSILLELVDAAPELHPQLIKILVTVLQDLLRRGGSVGGDSGAPGSQSSLVLDTACLQWICMLLSREWKDFSILNNLFEPLFATLRHPDTEVALAALHVLGTILKDKTGGGSGGGGTKGSDDPDAMFLLICRKLLAFFRWGSTSGSRQRLILRQLLSKVDAHRFFQVTAGILLEEARIFHISSAELPDCIREEMDKIAGIDKSDNSTREACGKEGKTGEGSANKPDARGDNKNDIISTKGQSDALSAKDMPTDESVRVHSFLSKMVETLHWILLTARETKALRENLDPKSAQGNGQTNGSNGQGNPLAPTLITAWLLNPLSALGLVLYLGYFKLAKAILTSYIVSEKKDVVSPFFSGLSSSPDFLNQLDLWVELWESPVYAKVRTTMLTEPDLMEVLGMLAMLLPQDSLGFHKLWKRIKLVKSIGAAAAKEVGKAGGG